MPSQDKLIKQGILLTDTTFDEIIKRLQNGVKTSDTLEAFLTKHKEVIVDNPLVAIGYKDKLTEIILQETNNHKFSRPAQKELTRLTIENRVGDLITNVGDDIKQDVRDIVIDGYNNNLSQDEIAANISDSISKIKNTRARVIARTEIARTATASDYVINRERGATHFKVDCRESCCPVCAERYNWAKNEFSIDDVGMLPPLHPNCRCFAMFFIKDDDEDDGLNKTTQTTTTTTPSVDKTTDKNNEDMLLSGGYEKYNETTDGGREVEVYKFNNIELAFETKGTGISFEKLKAHIDSLPKGLQTTNVKRIEILSTTHNELEYESNHQAAGLYYSDRQLLRVFNTKEKNEGYVLDVFNHEYAHAKDINSKGENIYSNSKVYEKIVKADNTHNGNELRYKFPTDYAGKSYLRDIKANVGYHAFVEDIADSTKKYLNPYTHDKFVKDFPNRAKYFESIYGKPDFTNTQFKKQGGHLDEETYNVYYHLDKLEEQYVKQLGEIDAQLEKVKETRKEYWNKVLDSKTDDEADFWNSKYRECRAERKRLLRLKEEIDDERHKIFKSRHT